MKKNTILVTVLATLMTSPAFGMENAFETLENSEPSPGQLHRMMIFSFPKKGEDPTPSKPLLMKLLSKMLEGETPSIENLKNAHILYSGMGGDPNLLDQLKTLICSPSDRISVKPSEQEIVKSHLSFITISERSIELHDRLKYLIGQLATGENIENILRLSNQLVAELERDKSDPLRLFLMKYSIKKNTMALFDVYWQEENYVKMDEMSEEIIDHTQRYFPESLPKVFHYLTISALNLGHVQKLMGYLKLMSDSSSIESLNYASKLYRLMGGNLSLCDYVDGEIRYALDNQGVEIKSEFQVPETGKYRGMIPISEAFQNLLRLNREIETLVGDRYFSVAALKTEEFVTEATKAGIYDPMQLRFIEKAVGQYRAFLLSYYSQEKNAEKADRYLKDLIAHNIRKHPEKVEESYRLGIITYLHLGNTEKLVDYIRLLLKNRTPENLRCAAEVYRKIANCGAFAETLEQEAHDRFLEFSQEEKQRVESNTRESLGLIQEIISKSACMSLKETISNAERETNLSALRRQKIDMMKSLLSTFEPDLLNGEESELTEEQTREAENKRRKNARKKAAQKAKKKRTQKLDQEESPLDDQVEEMASAEILERAKGYLEEKDYQNAAPLFESLRDFKIAGRCYYMAENYSQAALMFEEDNDEQAAAMCHFNGGNIEKFRPYLAKMVQAHEQSAAPIDFLTVAAFCEVAGDSENSEKFSKRAEEALRWKSQEKQDEILAEFRETKARFIDPFKRKIS